MGVTWNKIINLQNYLLVHNYITGNILINVGPTKDGIITPIYEERLLDLGEWLSVNGEAIYSSKPWSTQNDTANGNVWYTQKEDVVYGITLEWPENNELILGSVNGLFESNNTKIFFLENDADLKVCTYLCLKNR